jgi:hypothetical protein
MDSHRPAARCYHRVVREVAGHQREIGVGILLVVAVVVVPGLLTAGCYYPEPAFKPPMSSDGTDAGAGSGAGSAGSDADACFGKDPFRVCLAAAPTRPLMISELRPIDTAVQSNCVATVPAGSFGCVLAGTTITVAATLRAFGSRSLVLIASETIEITETGLVDVGSHRGATHELGAGADPQDPQACAPGQLPDRGGGAGGSFVGRGGKGGASDLFPDERGGTPGAARNAIAQLRGGCAGQAGAGTNGARPPGGHGGGAVLLIAVKGISVAEGGAINAAGEGGAGGFASPTSAGGGGGGAGGMIVLDAQDITSSGLILASSGGGGGGGSTDSPGAPGADPSTPDPAVGGAEGQTDGGRGGNGSTSGTTAGGGDGANGGTLTGGGHGGGGGGGTGIVKAPDGANLGLHVSPTRTP